MRASRLLHLLLLVQNRGRLTASQLAAELEVSKRTVLRDVEALISAGLPVVAHSGRGGGIELAFDFRTRLTGLATDEAEALGVLLGREAPELAALGMSEAGARAAGKVLESLNDAGRAAARVAQQQFRLTAPDPASADPVKRDDERIAALAHAVRHRQVVRVRARSAEPRTVHPVALSCGPEGWALHDARSPEPIPQESWGTVNISRRSFTTGEPGQKALGRTTTARSRSVRCR